MTTPDLPNPETRLIRVTVELMDELLTRTDDGYRLTVEWGDPYEAVGGESLYVPTVKTTDDGMRVVPAALIEEVTRLRAVADLVEPFAFCDATDRREPCNLPTCRNCTLRTALEATR